MLVALALACSPSPAPEIGGAEMDGVPDVRQRFTARHRWALADGVLTRDDQPVLTGVIGEVAQVDDRVVAAVVVEEPVTTDLAVIDGSATPRLLGLEQSPDRVALSPDGTHAAFVSGAGWASVWVVPVDLSEPPEQLTNVGLVRRKGGLPEGFVPPPLEPPTFRGDTLEWTPADGVPRSVRWR
ncbi:MAG: hypothetical protein H6736_07075 [Alphaproteobacteria bacterium]|nr:hypothetical protein [Alphaproteobacteria bacterium]MCB9691559.1 hypothetical protein [Alphaproteobacteria bacterium]